MAHKTISSIDVSSCTGCMACAHLCPQHAISPGLDNHGFRIPVIDTSVCLACGICYEKCPSKGTLNPVADEMLCYAAMADDETRRNSSSGGAFSVFADYILENGGIVIGAAYRDDLTVAHKAISRKEDLTSLRKSKYVQSDISDVFSCVSDCVKNHVPTLFVGTPCQCAAIKAACGSNENLFLMDILCMGVSSAHCLKKYFDEEFPNEHIKSVDFRYKKDGTWNQALNLRLETEKGEIVLPFAQSSYFLGFLKGITLRQSCKTCQYAGKERVGDITIGDFWGVDRYQRNLNDGKGTSMVILNTEKGVNLLEKVKHAFFRLGTVPFEVACGGNTSLRGNLSFNPKADSFWENYHKTTLRDNLSMLMKDTADCAIINYWYTNDHGAILTAFALQQFLLQNGYTSKLINLAPRHYNRKDGISQKFELNHLDSTYEPYGADTLPKLNGNFRYFLVGSDQVFRCEWVTDDWFLRFVDDDSYKIAIAASFGTDTINVSPDRQKQLRFLINRFNNVSVRENTGVNLCRKLGFHGAEWILDPVFLIDKEVYERIAKRNTAMGKTCFCYVRDMSEPIRRQISAYADEKKLDVVFCDEKDTIEEFLGNIMDCDTFITDSYHGLCFGIIFNKAVYCYKNKKRGNSRFESLENQIKLPKDLFIRSFEEDIARKQKLDFEEVDRMLRVEREKSTAWILNTLKRPDKVNQLRMNWYRLWRTSPRARIRGGLSKIKRIPSKIRKLVNLHE